MPVPQLAHFHKIIKEKSLIDELEKKFAGKSVIVLAEVRRPCGGLGRSWRGFRGMEEAERKR